MSHCCLSLFESYLNHLDPLGQNMCDFIPNGLLFITTLHRRRCHSISLLFPGIQLLDKWSNFSCMFSSWVFQTFSFWAIFDFWPLAGCVASDCETKRAVVQWLQGADAETFIKLKWHTCCPTTGVDIERNVCFDLSTGVKICQFLLTWRSKGNEVQNVISGGFWGFWDWDCLLLASVVPLKLWVLLMEMFCR